MHKLLILFLSVSIIISCQTNRQTTDNSGREVANAETWRAFIVQFSSKAKLTEESVEKTMIKYFQNKAANSKHGNYVSLGITDEQAQKIKTLADDLPYMPKVRKWGMENMDKIFPSVKKSLISDVYEEIVVGTRGVTNRYKMSLKTSTSTRTRQKQTSPLNSISEKREQLLADIRKVDDPELEELIRKNLLAFIKRGKGSPTVQANGQEIIESAIIISQKTGHKAIGEGCRTFTQNASKEVLEIKANLDFYRAKLIEARAYNKNNGRSFASVKDIPSELRLTKTEVDDASIDAFKKVLGYSDDKAREAYRRLKDKPCKLY
jgi:hypothetical protein